jgi:hypothetical protein
MFTVIIGLEDVGVLPTFGEAFKLFYTKVIEMVRQGTSLMALETTNSMTYQLGAETHVMDFDDVRHLGNELGLVKDGKLVEDAPEPDILVVEQAFRGVTWERRRAGVALIGEGLSAAGKCLEEAAAVLADSESA